jgi:hypothetical protein
MPKGQSYATRWDPSCPPWQQTEAGVLDRDVKKLFHLQPRAALRLMENVGPTNHAGEWRLIRFALRNGLKGSSILNGSECDVNRDQMVLPTSEFFARDDLTESADTMRQRSDSHCSRPETS